MIGLLIGAIGVALLACYLLLREFNRY